MNQPKNGPKNVSKRGKGLEAKRCPRASVSKRWGGVGEERRSLPPT
jgi:hypothetical protein